MERGFFNVVSHLLNPWLYCIGNAPRLWCFHLFELSRRDIFFPSWATLWESYCLRSLSLKRFHCYWGWVFLFDIVCLTHFAAILNIKLCFQWIDFFSSSDLCTTDFRFTNGAYLYSRASYSLRTFWFGSEHRRIMITSSCWFCANVVSSFCVFMVRIISRHPLLIPCAFSWCLIVFTN